MLLTQQTDAILWISLLFLVSAMKYSSAQLPSKSEAGESLVTGIGKVKAYRPALLRTELRFGRNLDPEKVRVVNVKSNNGDDVEILVGKDSRKARAGATHSFFVKSSDVVKPTERTPRMTDSWQKSFSKLPDFPHTDLLLKQSELVRQQRDYQQRKTAAENRQIEQLHLQLQKMQQDESHQIESSKNERNSRRLRYLGFEENLDQQQQQQQTSFRPSYIPLNIVSNMNSTNYYQPSAWKRDWQPSEVHDLRTRNLQLLQNRLVPMLFTQFDFQPILLQSENDEQVHNNEIFSEERKKRYYNGISSNNAQQLITKQNFFPTKATKFTPQLKIPPSVVISTMNSVLSPQKETYQNPPKKSATKVSQVVDGPAVTIIEGVRVPDMPEDQVNTWRNARVLNNQLVPYPDGYTPPKALVPTFDR